MNQCPFGGFGVFMNKKKINNYVWKWAVEW